MTRSDVRYRDRRRELENELRGIPAPSPPADLLDAIKNDIPSDLGIASEPEAESPVVAAPVPRPWSGSTTLRLAAVLGFVAVGAAIVLRLSDGAYLEVDDRNRDRAALSNEAREKTFPSAAVPRVEERKAGEIGGTTAYEIELPVDESRLRKMTQPLPAEPSQDGSDLDTARQLAEDEIHDARGAIAETAPVGDASTGIAGSLSAAQLTPEEAKEPASIAAPQRTEMANVLPRIARRDVQTETESRVIADVASAPASRGPLNAPPSTGGTSEPNDAPAGDMFFRSAGTNPFVDTAEDAQSTFALDVDTGSWTLARSYLERGALPPPEAIRVEEFVNAQEYDDPAPRHGEFTLVAEGAPSPFAPAGDYRVVRFAVKGREIVASDRKPSILTFVIDVSGSMAQGSRLTMVKRALGMLIDQLSPEDRIGLVVYGTRGRVLLDHTGDHARIRWAIESLRPEGSTNAEEGLRLGYDLAGAAYRTGRNNRVLLCSDGVANVGATGPESILERIGNEARRGIELTTVGFGMGNYNDVLMEQLADRGDGRYHYVDTLDEAERIFRENLTGTLETIAKDAKIQVEFDPATVDRWRLLGYENRDVADRDFRNDAVDAGEIGAGHSATAVYEVRLASGAALGSGRLGTLRLRWKSVATGTVEESVLTLRTGDLDRSFATASPNLRRAAVTAELAEILKHSFYAKEASWRTLREEAHRLEDEPASARRGEDLRWTIDRAAELSESSR